MMLSDKVALVTGGGRGIGRATALKLAAAGADVVVVARSEAQLEDVAEEIRANAGHATAHPADVTSKQEMDRLATWLNQEYGRLDILVNCAGVALIASLEETSEKDWDVVIDTNLKGTFLCTQSMLELLKAPGNALVVNVASKVGLSGHAMVSAYSAAKAGVIGLSRSLAQELNGVNIRVVTLCPGPVDTPMRWEATPQMDRRLVIAPETVAETILYLLKIDNRTTSGEIVLEAVGYDESLIVLEN
jgi:NAD(P)-dependent dehydrogenase (short-subunit alcohol dehydrogenase family)